MLLAVLSWAAVVAGTALLPKRDIHGYDVTSTISDAIAPRADTSRLVFAHYSEFSEVLPSDELPPQLILRSGWPHV